MWWVITSVWVLTLTAVATAQTSPPVITHFLAKDLVNPEDVKAKADEGFTLPCEATGSNLTWTWKHNDTEIRVDNSTFSLLDNGTLVGRKLLANNSGTYQCFVKDEETGAVAISRKLKVAVTVVGKFIDPKDVVLKVNLGEPLVYECPPHEHSYGVVFNWGNSDSTVHYTFARNERRSISRNGTLFIMYLTQKDIDEIDSYNGIRCIISGANSFQRSGTLRLEIDKNQTDSENFTLPSWSATPSAKETAVEGRNKTFYCFATGRPSPRITWKKDGQTIEQDQSSFTISQSLFGRLLFIDNIKKDEHEGTYTCEAENVLNTGKPLSFNTTLKVEIPPKWDPSPPPQNIDIVIEYNGTVECNISADPAPKITWYKDGATLQSSKNRRLEGHKLHLTDVTLDEAGMYQCQAVNIHGMIISSTSINVLEWKPSFENVQFGPFILLTGKEARLPCQPTAAPRPTFQWFRGGDLLTYDDNSRYRLEKDGALVIKEVNQDLDAVTYTCKAVNMKGEDSVSAVLKILVPAKLTTKPNNQTVSEGDMVTLYCNATGNPIPTITWKKDGKTVGAEATLQFETHRNNSGEYLCTAENGLNVTVNASATLRILYPPSITTKPSDTAVTENQRVSLRCFADGNPVPNITWIKDGKTVGEQTTLSFEAKREASGKYLCSVDNGIGDAASASAELTVQYSPTLTSKPSDKIIIEGSSVTFHCNATGNPTPEVTWSKNGEPVGDGNLLTFVANRNSSGEYLCSAGNGLSVTVNASANLDVQFTPIITSRPDDKIVIEGATVIFHCIATGNPTPNITWTKDGKKLATGDRLSFVTERKHSSQYWCSADNGLGGTVNASASLDVQFPPSIILRPSDKKVIETETVSFHCNATGNPAPKITWTKDGETVAEGETLTFVAYRNQSGDYWCSAENELNSTVTRAKLDVQFPPSLTTRPSDKVITENEEVTFKCAAIGKPAPRIWWVRNGEDLLEGNTLRFAANRSHSGKYWCLADNGLSEALNASAYLDVLYAPELASKPGDTTVIEGATVTLHCNATGNPRPDVTWHKDGNTVGTEETLSFVTKRNHSGTYWCTVDNGFNSTAHVSINLDVQFPSSLLILPTNQTVTEGANVTFHCSATGNPSPGIVWLKGGQPVASGETLTFEANSNHSGQYWCSARNGVGVTVNASAHLDVQYPPRFITQPSDQTVTENEQLEFRCSAIGNPVPMITWIKDGNSVGIGETLSLGGQRNLSGEYWCLADNGLGEAINSSATLEVQFPPSFIETPVDQIVLEGSSVTFRCLATGNPTPAVQWFKDGKLIGSEETLTFKANRDHDGKHWCSVSNSISEAINTSAILDVHFPPSLTTTPVDNIVVENEEASFHCAAIGNPVPNITWIKDGITVGKRDTLSFVANRDQSGEYWCLAENGLSKNVNASASLDVQFSPSLTTAPTDRTLLESTIVTFHCNATGNPAPNITWTKDGKTVGTGVTLSFEAKRSQTGVYWCSASNGLDKTVNASALLDVQYAPSLTTRPSNQTVIEADNATFRCTATGNPTPQITWTKDGTTVGTGETLSFEAFRNQSGRYWCSANNGFSSTANASAYLDVQFLPTLTTKAVNQTVNESDHVTLHCSAIGNPVPKITWYKDGEAVATGSELSFTASRNSSGKYWCLANNGLNVTVNSIAYLNVQYPPSFTREPENQTVAEYEKATWNCEATGNPVPEIKWMKDGITVGEGNTLILEALRNKTGQYLCLAYNGLGGAIKTRFHLDVQYPPTLSTTPIDLTLPEKHIATFHCIALGNPVPKITWSKDGDTVGTGNTLRFEVQRKDSGKYLCTADNGLSTTVNASAYLNVLFPPSLSSKPIDQAVIEGSRVTFYCNATGNPVPSIKWSKDGKPVGEGNTLGFIAMRNQSGKYWCSAKNGLNSTVNASAYLDVKFPPSLTIKPENKTAIVMDVVIFHCSATGNPTPNITWINDGKTVGTGETLSFATDRKQSGEYWCSADNGLSKAVIASTYLDVLFPPDVTDRPANITVNEGDEATFHCAAMGNPVPTITWIKDGAPLDSGNTLSFIADRTQSGEYWCSAENGVGSSINTSAYLDVQFAAILLTTPTNQTVIEGNEVSFLCTAFGNPVPDIKWFRDDIVVGEGGMLTLQALRSQSGEYWCIAENGFNETANASAFLDVQFAPSFTTTPSNQTIIERNQVTFTCSATGNPVPNITWTKDGETVHTGETLSFVTDRTRAGEYWCLAENVVREAIQARVYLDVQFGPTLTEIPSKQTVTEGDEVTFRCAASGNPSPQIKWIKDGMEVGEGETLTLHALRNKSGEYWCVAGNAVDDKANASALLDVQFAPSFTITPSDQIVTEKEQITFTCTASGNPVPNLTWIKDGKTVGKGDKLSFEARRNHSGIYWCSADNGIGKAINASASLDVKHSASLDMQPTNQTVVEGAMATFYCNATGNPAPQIKWLKDGKTVGVESTLAFTTERNHSGRYWCLAENSFNATVNAIAYLNVQYPPSFTSLPVNQTIKKGEAATFHCSVSGNPMPKVKWYRGGKVVAQGDTIRISGANRNDSGEYWCSADNGLGVNINASVHLNVQFPGTLIRRPSDQTVIEGAKVTFHCGATGNPSPTVTWLKDGKPVAMGEKLSFEAQRNKSGKYWCMADNGVPPSVNASAFLGVHFPPSFSRTPVDHTVREGEKVMFHCTAVGSPTPNITWTKDGKTIGTEYTLSLDTSRNDSGDYQCSAGNGIGQTITAAVSLNVHFSPSLVTTPADQVVVEGAMATLHCSATGNPSPNITWLKDGKPVGMGQKLSLEAYRNKSGKYWCSADNGLQPADNASAVLDVQYAPSFLRNPVDHTVQEGEKVMLRCTAVGNPTPTITWTKDGKTVGTDGTLSLDTTRNDSGQYQCSAGNGIGGDITTVVNIDVTFPPSLVSMPADRTVTEGVMATLYCSATGNPVPEITWIKDGKTVGRGETLKLEGKRNQTGEYWCTAENGLNSTANTSAYLDVQYPPSLTSTPVDKTVREGDEITLHCTASGNPSPKIKWTRDGKFASEGNTMRFVAHRNQSGKYWCSADNGVGETVNTSAYLSVLFTPQATVKTNYQAVEGSVIQLHCSATSNPPPNITWSKDGIILAKGALLSFKARRNQSGEYTCLADNGLNRTANVTTYLDVHFKPERTIITVDLDITKPVQFGSSVAFNCTTLSHPDPDGYNFYYGDQKLGSNNTGIYHHQLRRSGDYSCVPFNSAGEGKKALLRIVVRASKPSFDKNLFGPFYLFKGIQARLPCKPVAEPYPTFKWLKDGVAVRHGKNDSYRIDADGSLIILKVGDSDSGQYTCVAENYLGKRNATADGILLETTQIVVKPQNKTVVKGTGVDLRCKATADPLLELIYIWKRDGADITDDANIQWQDGESVLQLSDISFKDAGVYTCVVYTPEPRGSEDSASAIVSIAGVPSPPINLQITECYDRRTNLSWTPDISRSSEITHYLIEQESNHNPFVFNLIYNVTNPNTTSLTLDLPGWSSLQFRVKAVNDFGPSRPSVATDAGICITPVGSPESYPMNLRGVPKKANELSITWTPMSKLEWNAPGCYYILRYRKVNIGYVVPWETEKIGDPRVHVFAVSNPGYYQLWEFKIRAGNQENLGTESPVRRSFSGQNAPAVKPESAEVEAVTASTVALAWEPVTLNKGSVDGYKIYYWGESRSVRSRRRRQVIPSDAEVITAMGGQTQQATLTGLKPYANYKVVVKAFNSGGEGPASAVIVFRTLEGEPGPPSDLQTYAFGEYILVTWKPPKEPNGIIIYYQVGSTEYNASSPDTASVTMQNVGPGVFKKLLGNQAFEKSYVVEVRAKTSKGWGESAKTITTTMKKSAPAKPKKPTVVGEGEDSISFMYHFGVGGGWTHEFKILYRKKDEGGEFQETDWVDHFTTQRIKVTDLKTEVYEFKTIGRNPEGTSPPSDVTEARPHQGPVIDRAQGDPPIYRSDWFITLIILSAGTLLLLVIILVYRTWKRRRSSNFKVTEHEKEEEPKVQIEEGIPVDIKPREKWRQNLQDRLEEESQDSLDEYGGDTAYFSEDGSFVGDLKQGRNTDSVYDEIPEPAV